MTFEPATHSKSPGERSPQDARTKVLYIAGCGRSGSTLLMRLLAETTGGVAIGELFHLWHHGYQENFICGCGAQFSECPFWLEVNRRMFGVGQSEVDAGRMCRLQQRVHGPKAVLPLRFKWLRTPRYREAIEEYAQILSRLYRTIAETAGTNLVIDSSKSPQLARMLEGLPNVETHLVHLVRDSRATAWSWQRVRAEPALGASGALMHQFPVWRSAIEWTANHALLLLDRRRPFCYTVCKYENFVNNPRNELMRLISTNHSPAKIPAGEFVLQKSHSVTGNPNRFSSGPVAIAGDAEWETAMRLPDRLVVTAISWPLLKWFRYSLRAPRGR